MNLRNTAIWLVIFVALGLFAWSLRDSDPRQVGPNAPTATPNPVFDFAAAAVTAVRVEGDGSSYELTRDDADDWLIDGQAASDMVDGTISGATDPNVLRVLPEDRDPDDYGFASPWLTVTFTVSDTQRQLFIGDEVPTSSGDRYVREGAEGIIRTVSAFDFDRLHEWLTEPPYAPTPTPIPTETPEGGAAEDGEATEGEEEALGDGEDADAEADEEGDAGDEDVENAGGDEEDGSGTDEGAADPVVTGTPAATETPAPDAGDDG